jgi:hypothetical protein
MFLAERKSSFWVEQNALWPNLPGDVPIVGSPRRPRYVAEYLRSRDELRGS